jgi:glycosyltransferase involved in cell wall biosynthesis
MSNYRQTKLRSGRTLLNASWLALKLEARAWQGWLQLRWLGSERGPEGDVLDTVLIAPPASAQGWILAALCQEIATRLRGRTTQLVASGGPLPAASCYFFSHYMYFAKALADSARTLKHGKVIVFATHLEPDKHGLTTRQLVRLLRRCDEVICMNTALRQELLRAGADADKLHVVLGAADARVYRPHDREADGYVGFCSAYYARKSPDLVVAIARHLPHRKFVLLGRGWQQFDGYAALLALPNFEYVETDYKDYAPWYARMTVFVSVSRLEGGPIPLIEAMMCNAVPVASRTGFAPDLVRHGHNGYLFDADASVEDICRLIENAFVFDADVAATVRHCDWDEFVARVERLMPPNRPRPLSIDSGSSQPSA